MDEYISREEVLSRIYATHSTGGFANEEAYLWLHDAITNLSADAQPVKHGRWKYYRNNGIIDTYICTNCQGKVEMAIDIEPNEFKFCPNCGCKQDL